MLDRDRLRSIKTFPALVKYLRDDLGWPIDAEDFEDLTFDYEPKELGIDAKTAAKIDEIKQLRPLATNQPWGIFFVRFEPKRLPVVALRRVLSGLVIKKRASARSAEQAAWNLHDLLFISSYGEGEDRQITFAHFSEDAQTGGLPTLKVLGWDDADTVLHLDHVHRELEKNLRWPEVENDSEAWRARWSSAFTLRHREVIRTSKDLAVRLADLAKRIRTRADRVLAIESERGALRKLHKAFKEALIHDLSESDFADMYAQTVTYGLFSAAVSRPAGVTADNLADMVPITNPFLKEMLGTFLTAGGRRGKIDFDELGIQDVVELLNSPDTHMDAVLRDFGNRTRQEDPVVHFYELFLAEYDKKKKVQRGVFYTPQPVVSYIVRSVHELLQKEFGLEDGLASTVTWGEMIERNTDLKLPPLTDQPGEKRAIDPGEPFVQILDPATGTATFLVEVIDVIYKTMTAKWKKQGLNRTQRLAAWNEYVPEHLLPRVCGYELMMAPYAIAHLKIGLKLHETGYRFGSDERARIYLTNALEPAHDFSGQFEFAIPALAHEAHAVNEIKRKQRFTVIVGNPPYSKASQNLGEQFASLIERFRMFCGERIREPGAILFERDINNDYVKFLGMSQNLIKLVRLGILGMITSNSYLDGKNFRGVRDALTASFNELFVVDLHGDNRSRSLARQGTVDENVFDIETGVCILLAIRTVSAAASTEVVYSEAVGTYGHKAALLLNYDPSLRGDAWPIDPRRYKSFLPSRSSVLNEYAAFRRLDEVYGLAVDGIKTSRDGLVVANTATECASKIQAFMNFSGSAEELEQRFGISVAKWDYRAAQKRLQQTFSETRIFRLAYRPLDFRYIYYDSHLVFSHREEKMSHLIRGNNLALVCASRLSAKGFNHILPADCLVEMKYASHDTNSRVFPALLCADSLLDSEAQLNIGIAAVDIVGRRAALADWMDLTEAVLAVLNSTEYRTRYYEEIKNDFPGLPPLADADLRRDLAKLGRRLIRAQLLHAEVPEAAFPFSGTLGEKMETPELDGNSLRISGSSYFTGVGREIFEFDLAGYQVCKTWVSAGNRSGIQRKGTILTAEEAQLYRRVLFAAQETMAARALIDDIVVERLVW